MFDIASVDKNFQIGKTINKEGVKFYNPLEKPFSVYGITYGNDIFYRMPPEVAESVSEGVNRLNYHTAGGRICFRTDSPYVAISVVYGSISKFSHEALCGSAGFDLYADNVYVNTFKPEMNIVDTYEGIMATGERKMKEIVINFPLYSSVKSVYVGLDETATVEAPTPYANTKPVVYYGSSITQGACASRPGTCYQAYLSREFNLDYINLGFAGNARAEDTMIDYVKGLDMSIFVYDYDHNAPNVDHLIATHEKMFRAVREAHPDIPIIMMSRPKRVRNADENRRLEVVKSTYVRAKAMGDKNVYFLDGDDLTELCGNNGTVDNCHPTDFGFASMAKVLIELFKNNGLA